VPHNQRCALFAPLYLYAPPQHVDLAHVAWWASEAILAPLSGCSMHCSANGLRRIPLPRTRVNKGKIQGPELLRALAWAP
jgi:hypothetical protein